MNRLLEGIRGVGADLRTINERIAAQQTGIDAVLDEVSAIPAGLRPEEPELDLFGEPRKKPGDPEKAAVLVGVKAWYLAVRQWKNSGSESTKTRKELLDQCLEREHALRDVAEAWMQEDGWE